MQYAKDRWQQPDLNWRVVTAYDTTKAIIKAIELSTVVTRAAILEKLEQIDLPVEYSIWQIHHGRFEEIQAMII
jgi:ABC-type branched-subunit amino acid transport system substrate-binding protein